MHPEQIKAAIRMSGSRPSVIAEELKLSRATVSHVIHGLGTSARVARRISEVTGISVEQLWPGRYPETAKQKTTKRIAKSSGH